MNKSFLGRYAVINLSDKTYEKFTLKEEFYKKYLGGYGLGAAILMELQKPGTHPLSPDAHLGFVTGLLTGTKSFFSGRLMIVGKSPLTEGFGESNAGGFFASELKKAGFDAVFFKGKSEKPVWINITNDDITFQDASCLWGKDVTETENLIQKELNKKKCAVASIGEAGEKLSLISGIVTDKARIAARSGLGAVMGSKNLKAVSVQGNLKLKLSSNKQKTVDDISKKFISSFKRTNPIDKITIAILPFVSKIIALTGISVPSTQSLVRAIYKKYGTSGLTTYSALTGDMPIKNWRGIGYKEYKKHRDASDKNVIKYQKKRYHCQSCPLGCGGIIEIQKGKFKGKKGHKPEYETIGAFGGLLLNEDYDSIIELNEICNRAGIDTISMGGVLAFAIECYKNGILSDKELNNLKLDWGKSDEIIELANMIIKREGIGDILADGVKKASEKIGQGSKKYAVHSGGQELPMHDSRYDEGLALAYECDPSPGRHTYSSFLYSNLFKIKKQFKLLRKRTKRTKGLEKKTIKYLAGNFYMQLINGAGVCFFAPITSNYPLFKYINAVCGWNLTNDEYFKIGERILNLKKVFNEREKVFHKINERSYGYHPLTKNFTDINKLKLLFFKHAGWSIRTGYPTFAKLKELNIENFKIDEEKDTKMSHRFQSVKRKKKTFKSIYLKIMLFIMARAIPTAAKFDKNVQREFKKLPDNYAFSLEVMPDYLNLRMIIGKDEQGEVRFYKVKENIPLRMKIRNIEAAFLLFTFFESTSLSASRNRIVVDGDIDCACSVIRIFDIVESYILPKFIAKLAVKRYPFNSFFKKVLGAIKIYLLLLFVKGKKEKI